MSTIISIPPLFGLENPQDATSKSFQTHNQSLNLSSLQPTPDDALTQDLSRFDDYHSDALEYVEFSYSDFIDPFYADASLVYEDEGANGSLSYNENILDCIISQNLGYTRRRQEACICIRYYSQIGGMAVNSSPSELVHKD